MTVHVPPSVSVRTVLESVLLAALCAGAVLVGTVGWWVVDDVLQAVRPAVRRD